MASSDRSVEFRVMGDGQVWGLFQDAFGQWMARYGAGARYLTGLDREFVVSTSRAATEEESGDLAQAMAAYGFNCGSEN